MKTFEVVLLSLLVFVCSGVGPVPVFAENPQAPPAKGRDLSGGSDVGQPKGLPAAARAGNTIVLTEGGSKDVGGEGVASVIVSDPKVVKVVATQDNHLIVIGKGAGSSDISKVMKTGELIVYHVKVEKRETQDKRSLVREINETLSSTYPASHLSVRDEDGTLILEGGAANDYDLDGALNYLKGFTKKIVNLSSREGTKQVKLDVKIIEVNRTKLKNLGANFLDLGKSASFGIVSPSSLTSFKFDTGILSSLEASSPVSTAFQLLFGSGDISTIISIMEQENIARTLSNPSLITEAGGDAKFFVGGTIPIPVPQTQGLVTIEWKDFGIRLEFRPEIARMNRIKLKIKAESSELNKANGVTLVGTRVPGIDIRRIQTNVTLSDNEQFIIGGLYYSKHLKDLSRVPYLADIPVLGAFFKRVEESDEDLELIAVIKTEFVSPEKEGGDKVEELLKPSRELTWPEILLKR